jgi:hypothetical protein
MAKLRQPAGTLLRNGNYGQRIIAFSAYTSTSQTKSAKGKLLDYIVFT